MKNFRGFLYWAFAVVFATALLCSCSKAGKATVDCTLADAPGSEVIVKLLNINQYEVLDTVKTDASGKFIYKVPVRDKQPEFVYLFYNDVKIASLLLQKGERAVVNTDTLGRYTVFGSAESAKLQEVENDFANFSAKFMALIQKADECDSGSEESLAFQREATAEYVNYYRDRVGYVLAHSSSLTSLPVLFQTTGNGLPIFSQETDAIHFKNVCDSLEVLYPESRYVKALRQETQRRVNLMELSFKLGDAAHVDFLDIEMPDVNGVKRKLSDVEAKVTMLHFWSSEVALQKMYNIEVLKPVYELLHSQGFEIFEVALDTGKASWARVVRDQGLDWINVCDGLGQNSPVISKYNITTYPVSYFVVNGVMTNAPEVSDASALLKEVEGLLAQAE